VQSNIQGGGGQLSDLPRLAPQLIKIKYLKEIYVSTWCVAQDYLGQFNAS